MESVILSKNQLKQKIDIFYLRYSGRDVKIHVNLFLFLALNPAFLPKHILSITFFRRNHKKLMHIHSSHSKIHTMVVSLQTLPLTVYQSTAEK
jgi:hypothetical protein